ncbi:MAG: hypothetical protein KJO29_02040 [Bacteroidia bacterium]|nr:hypothetical protein [Bacteroidia bacterium]
MKLRNYYLIAISGLILGVSCNSDSKPAKTNQPESSVSANQDRLKGLKKEEDTGNIAAMRAQALSILNYRLKNNPESYAIVEAGVWEYQFVFDGKMSEPGEYDGVWIDFKADFTYEYGENSSVKGSGRYNYHFERGELLMIDNDNSMKPQEWQCKNAGDAMVLIGTHTYQDNSIQMKLVRGDESIRQ